MMNKIIIQMTKTTAIVTLKTVNKIARSTTISITPYNSDGELSDQEY